MDSTWPYNFDCQGVPTHLPSYYDKLIIPQIFYNGVINRNVTEVNQVIKYNPKLCIAVVNYYDTTLRSAFFYKKNAKFGMPNKIRWVTLTDNNKIILNFNEQVNLYNYITTSPWKSTNMGFLINCINNYLIQLRFVLGLINNKIPVNNYFYLGVNVHNNIEMKNYIAQFIPGYLK
jgi:hypothetical protein